jgi:hypothetical protein
LDASPIEEAAGGASRRLFVITHDLGVMKPIASTALVMLKDKPLGSRT